MDDLIQTRLITPCQTEWQGYTQHRFVRELAAGTLPKAAFQHYLKQDFLFLRHYARAYALAVYKSPTLDDMRKCLPALQGLIEHEIGLHIEYCREWGLSEDDLQAVEEDVATVAYTRYVLDCGHAGDYLDLNAALAPCALGYAVIGKELAESPEMVWDDNPYRPWMEMYSGDEFQQGAVDYAKYINSLLAAVPADSTRWAQLQKTFSTATRMEIAFWEQGYQGA